jgi:type II secretory pathway pseudopilin PulG
MRTRRGFTLAEVLLALILIDVGLLALVAGSAVLVRQMNALRLRSAALRAATNRLEQLGGGACASGSGVATSAVGFREEWSLTPLANGVLDVRDSVSFALGTATHAVVLHTRLPC